MANAFSFTGAFSAATLSVPGVYVNVRPLAGVIAPAIFGRVGVVGVASWGPKNVPTIIGNTSQLAMFGNPTVRAFDAVTAATVILQIQQYAGSGANLMISRVTDGTDAAATGTLGGATGLTLTSKYTGTGGNGTLVNISAGSTTGTWKIIVQRTGFPAEIFDNIGLGLTGNALWLAIRDIINAGNTQSRGPSDLVVASAGVSTTAPSAGSVSLTGGTDGASTVVASGLVGLDTTGARTGVYAYRNTGCTDLVIADFSDVTQEANLQTFASSEGLLIHTSGPLGESVSTAQTSKATQGTDNPFLKRYLGDWIYWVDNLNGGQRLIAPATFGAAVMSTMRPEQSGLNKQIPSIVATQRSRTGVPYGNDELAILVSSGIEVIANPIPRGSMFGFNIGLTSTSDGSRKTDNWPRLTSFIVRSLLGPGALGTMIGEEITDDFFRVGYDMLDVFLAGMQSAGTIEKYQIVFDRTNNPQAQTASGTVIAEVKIRYLGIASVFLVNLQSGATVVVPDTSNIAVVAAALAA